LQVQALEAGVPETVEQYRLLEAYLDEHQQLELTMPTRQRRPTDIPVFKHKIGKPLYSSDVPLAGWTRYDLLLAKPTKIQ